MCENAAIVAFSRLTASGKGEPRYVRASPFTIENFLRMPDFSNAVITLLLFLANPSF
jgi:hypothetical protein